MAGGLVWIAVVAVLAAGVVAMNVSVLRLNVELEELGRERTRLRAENADLSARLASGAASGRIQALARKRLGLLPADSTQTTYLRLDRPAR